MTYPLLNGCHACARLGLARFGWDFDASGKFLRTTYIPTPPPPKLLETAAASITVIAAFGSAAAPGTTESAMTVQTGRKGTMRKALIFLAVVILTAFGFAQSTGGNITAASVWKPGSSFVATARAACGKPSGSALGDCLISQMTKAGAPASAVQFSRRVLKLNGEVGIC